MPKTTQAQVSFIFQLLKYSVIHSNKSHLTSNYLYKINTLFIRVLLSITPAYVQNKVAEGGSLGKSLQNFKDEIDRPLSAILSLNTIAHTVGAIGVGAQAGKVFGDSAGFLGISNESIIAGLMTLAILVLSEIIPKTIGANNWKSLVPFTVRSLNILLIVLFPLVWLSQAITKRLKNNKGESVLSRADFAAMARIGKDSGALQARESTIIDNLLKFEKVKVKDIMTPRTLVKSAEQSTTVSAFYEANKESPFSRIPIYETDADNITGFVLKDDILHRVAEDEDHVPLKNIKRDIVAVQEERTLPGVLEDLIAKQSKISTVVDQYGSLLGVVTLEDVIETLLGLEIVDETDKAIDLQQLARKKWEERAKKSGLVQ